MAGRAATVSPVLVGVARPTRVLLRPRDKVGDRMTGKRGGPGPAPSHGRVVPVARVVLLSSTIALVIVGTVLLFGEAALAGPCGEFRARQACGR